MNKKIIGLFLGLLMVLSIAYVGAGKQAISKNVNTFEKLTTKNENIESTQMLVSDEITVILRPSPGLIFSRGIEIVFTNNGPDTINNIIWSCVFSTDSGFILLNDEYRGEIDEIQPGEEQVVQCSPFGLGQIQVQFEGMYGKNALRSDVSAFLFLPFIFNMQNTDDILTLDISGLASLGENYAYEGWVIVDGAPVSTGTFGVNDEGELMKTQFNVDADNLAAATAFVLTIEPFPDSDPAPSSTHILAGDFTDETADLNIGHPAAFGDDFTSSTGEYLLATPSTTTTDDELSGVWFLNPNMGDPIPGLSVPDLPAGWKYEGWAVIDGMPVSTGKFIDPGMADEGNPYSGPEPTPPFPGEDFVENAPSGLTFPTSLEGDPIVLTIEPDPDNSPAPFLLKPLVGVVPDPAMDHTVYMMDNNAEATNPTGTATIGTV